jgi:hypothetical protein
MNLDIMYSSKYKYSFAEICFGSGGDYLSNEIFFRVAVLRNHLNLNNILKSGHLHVPLLQQGKGDDFKLEATKILINNVKKIIGDAIQGL